MNLTARLEKLEQKTGKSEFKRFHIVIVKPGCSKESAIQAFKNTHDVSPGDDFMIIALIAPDPYI